MLMAVVGDAAMGRISIRHQNMSKSKIHSPSLVPGGLSRNRANVLSNDDDEQGVFTAEQHRSPNSNYIPIDHPLSGAPTLQGNSDVAEASVTAAQGKRPRAVTKHKEEILERPLKRSRNGEDAGSRRNASFKRGTRGARGPYGPRPAKEQKAMERKALLEADQYAYKVRVHWVRCVGCDNDISLDKRSEYYPGLWIKHRRKCKEIAKLREKEGESVKGDQIQRPEFQYPPLPLGGRTQFEDDGEPSRSSTPTLSSPQVSGSARILEDTWKKLDDDAHSDRSSYSEPRYDPDSGAPSSFTVERQYEGRQDTIDLEDVYKDGMIVCPPRLAKSSWRAIYAQWLKSRAMYQPNWSEEERVYWSYAPFAPADLDQSASKVAAASLDSDRVHYRFSNRWELETGFRDAKQQLAELTKGGIGNGS